MAKNKNGKEFEEDFVGSLPSWVFHLRLKDTAGWSRDESTRFSSKNLCDFIFFDGTTLLLAELKTTDRPSVSEDKLGQAKDMAKVRKHNVVPVFIIQFKKLAETYAITAYDVMEVLKTRKSVPVDFCREHGIRVPQFMKRTHYGYTVTGDLFKWYDKY